MTREFVTLFFVLVLLTVNNEVEGARDYFLLKMTHRPWKEDPTCSAHQIGFITNHTYPLMALVSYPGSGNTWIRQLIEGLTGFFTGSVYEDMDIFLKGMLQPFFRLNTTQYLRLNNLRQLFTEKGSMGRRWTRIVGVRSFRKPTTICLKVAPRRPISMATES